jgi:hypothetical protein
MGSVTLINAVAIGSGGGGGTWGSITGVLTNQTDLANALSLKFDKANLTDPGTGFSAVKALGVDTNGNAQLNVLNQLGAQNTLLAAAGTLGQIAVPNDSTGIVVYSGTAGSAQLLQAGGARLVVNCSTYSTTTGTNLTNYYTLTTPDWRWVYFSNVPIGCTPIVVTPPTAGYPGQLISFACSYADNTAFTLGVTSNNGTNTIKVRCSQELTLVYAQVTSSTYDWQIFSVDNIAADNYGTYPATRNQSSSPVSGTTPFGIAGGIASGVGAGGSLAIGSNSRAVTTKTIALGSNSLATAIGALAIGPSAQATTGYSLAVGSGATASGAASVAINMGNSSAVVASGPNSVAVGTSSLNMSVATRTAGGTDNTSKVVYEFALQNFSVTTGTTELFLDGGPTVVTGAAGTTNRFAFPITTSVVWHFICDVVGRVPGNTASLFHAKKTCLFHISSTGTITTQLVSDMFTPVAVGLSNNIPTPSSVISIGSYATDKAITLSVAMATNTDGNMSWTAYCEVRLVA